MKILVTGGAGFIGSHIVDAYVRDDHEVLVMDDLSAGHLEHVNPAARFFEADIRSEDAARIVIEEKPEAINHHAAQIDVRNSVVEPVADIEINVAGTVNLLEAARRAGTRKAIFASTGGAMYGETREQPATETDPPRPVSHYGVSKWSCEQYFRLYADLYGLHYTVLRYPNVYGPRQNPQGESGVCAILAQALLQGERPVLRGDGLPVRDYVHVSDITRANVAALTMGDDETLNLGSGEGVSVRTLFETYQALIGTRIEPELAPLRLGELRQALISGDKARSVLGWSAQIALRDGLESVVAYLREGARLDPTP